MRQNDIRLALDNGGGDGVYYAAAGTLETLFFCCINDHTRTSEYFGPEIHGIKRGPDISDTRLSFTVSGPQVLLTELHQTRVAGAYRL